MKGEVMKKLLTVFWATTLLIGCEVTVKDGKVPKDYIQLAQKYVGTYQGHFNNSEMDLNLTIETDGKVVLEVKNLDGQNQLIRGCQSQVGKLVYADIDKRQKVLKSVNFAFNPGNCPVAGRRLEIYFQSERQITVSVAERTQRQRVEIGESCVGPWDDKTCYPVYDWTDVAVSWLNGEFAR